MGESIVAGSADHLEYKPRGVDPAEVDASQNGLFLESNHLA
jgi:hypothetical protein